MRVGVVGSRKRNKVEDKKKLFMKIKELEPTEIVSGGCKKGADAFAEEIAEFLNIPTKIFLPKLSYGQSYHKAVNAYYARNKEIAQYCDLLIAIVSKERKGGTENTIKHAEASGKEIILL